MKVRIAFIGGSLPLLFVCPGGAPAAEAGGPWGAISSEIRCDLDTQRGESCLNDESVLILDERARASLGTRTMAFPETRTVILESAYTETPDGRKVDVSPAEIQRGEVPGDSDGFLGAKFIKLAFREVQVGSRLHLRYRSQSPASIPFTHVSKAFQGVSGNLRWDRIIYIAAADVPLHWKGENLGTLRVRQDDAGKRLQIELGEPIYTPPPEEGQSFVPRNLARIEISSAESWADYLAPVARGFAEQLGRPLPVGLGLPPPGNLSGPERVRRVLDQVERKLRYMGDWRESVHGYLPFSLAEIEQRGFGDCKDLALTTVALLQAQGIPAEVVLVHSGADDRKPLLPTLQYLNHAIVRARVEGQTVWLDPTQQANTLAAPHVHLQNRVAFVLGSDGTVIEDWIPQQDARLNQTTQTLDLSPENGHWHLAARVIQEGIEAANGFNEQAADAETDERAVRELLPGSATLLERKVQRKVVNSSLIDRQETVISARVGGLTRRVGSYQLLEAGYLGGTLAALKRFQASMGQGDFPQTVVSHRRLVRIHGKPALEPVRACEVSSPWIDLSVAPLAVDNGVGYEVKLQKKGWILATEMQQPGFVDFIDRLEDCADNLRLLLK